MESLKKFPTAQTNTLCSIFDPEKLARYNEYIQKVSRESERRAMLAWQKTRDIILDRAYLTRR